MIHIENLHKSFGNNKVLQGLNIDFDKQGITALLGPNGSGKTTLIKCILGMVLPDNGKLLFESQNINKQFNYRNRISYLPQIARFPENLTVSEIIQFMKNIRTGASKEKELISLFNLEKEMDKKLSHLSGGTRQKLNLTLSFMYDSPVIFLDEPSTGLDPIALLNLKNYLIKEKERGIQIIIITHILSFVEEIANNIVFILDGKIYYQGDLKELLNKQQSQNLELAIAKILRSDETNI